MKKIILHYITLPAFVFTLLILGSYWLITSTNIEAFVSVYGYPAMFIVALISGFNVLIPIPAVAFVPLMTAAGLSLWITLFIIVVGMSLGDTIGYLLGRYGRKAIEGRTLPFFFLHCDSFIKRHPKALFLFVFFYGALVPAPNEIIVVPLAVLECRWTKVLLPLFLGNAVFTIIATFGVISLFSLF